MKDDPIIEELHEVRARIAAKFNNDLRAICEDARARQSAAGTKPVALPPRRPEPRTTAAKKAG
jgi:hypothetical protein